jgi:hypothetical protein
VQHYKVLYILGRVAQAKRERCQNAPGQDLRGEWFSSGELRHHVGEQEEYVMQGLLGRSRN